MGGKAQNESSRRGLRAKTLLLSALVLFAAILAGSVWFVRERMLPRPDVVVLVASARDGERNWGDWIYRELDGYRRRLPANAIAVRRVRQALTSAAQARAEGDSQKASLLVWGRASETGMELSCEFLRSPLPVRVAGMPLAEPERLAQSVQGKQADLFARMIEGWLYFALGQSREAAESWDHTLALASPGEAPHEQAVIHVYQALLLLAGRQDTSQQSISGAVAHLQEATRLDPSLFAAHYNLALVYMEWCDPEGGRGLAWKEAQAAVALRPEEPRGYELLGDLSMLEKRWNEAVAAYTAALRYEQDRLALWNKLGQVHHALGNVAEAQAAFRAALDAGQRAMSDVSTVPAAVWAELGLAYRYQGSPERSLEAYQVSLEQEPDNAETYCRLADAYRQQGQIERAAAAYQKALDINPEHARIHAALADLYREMGQLQAAEASYQKAIELAPCEGGAYLALGQFYFAQGKYDLARQLLRRGLAIHPGDASAQLALGTLCYLARQWDEAIRAFEVARSLQPNSAEPYLGLANVYLQQARYELAIAAYRQVLTLAPEAINALVGLGDAYRELKQFEQAETAYQQAVKLRPRDAGIRLSLALLYDRSGQLDKAEAAYRQALAMDTARSLQDEVLLRAALASVCQRQGKLELAAREYEEALRFCSEENVGADFVSASAPELMSALALIYIAQDRVDEALALTQQALLRRPEYAFAHFLLGLACEKKGDRDKAITAYEAAMRYSGADQTLRQNAETQLNRLRGRQ